MKFSEHLWKSTKAKAWLAPVAPTPLYILGCITQHLLCIHAHGCQVRYMSMYRPIMNLGIQIATYNIVYL